MVRIRSSKRRAKVVQSDEEEENNSNILDEIPAELLEDDAPRRSTRSRSRQSYKEASDDEASSKKSKSDDEDETMQDKEDKSEKSDEDEEEKPRRRVVRRAKRASKKSTITDDDYEQPERSLRSSRKSVNYAETDSDTEMQDASEEEAEAKDDSSKEEEEASEKKEEDEEKKDEEEEEEKSKKSDNEEEEKPKEEEGEDEEPKVPVRRRRTRTSLRKKKSEDSEEEAEDKMEEDGEESNTQTSEGAEIEPPIVNYGEESEDDEDQEVEKILACRPIQNAEKEDEIEYLVKYKDKSYLHVEWITQDQLESNAQNKKKLQRFLKTYSVASFEGLEEYFNPDYCEVDRILDVKIWNQKNCYLVKWKSLGYTESTWEFEDKISEKDKIEEFLRNRKYPVKYKTPGVPPAKFFVPLKESPKFKNGNQLREYQLEGLNWLVFCWYHKRNSILADEMGLGKTVQTVSMLEYLRTEQHIRGPFLIVAPLSTIQHWRREVETWTEMNCVVFHGKSQHDRQSIIDHEFYYRDKRGNAVKGLYKFNVLITTYEVVLAETTVLKNIPWQYLVVDEGHRLKNKNAKLLEQLRKFSTVHKLLLTGTPIQNDMGEMWTLLNYLDEDEFDSEEDFMEQFGDVKDHKEIESLHKKIGPYLLRRLKEDVEKSIPPKEEIVVEVVPTNVQKLYYRAIIERNRDFLKRGVSSNKSVPQLINVLMEIRKVCNHPFLINGAEENITKGMNTESANEMLIKCCSKLVLVDKLLKKLREGNHKVLIFSQMVMVLNILEDYLNYRKYPYCRLDGGIRGDLRQAAIDRFSNPNIDTFVFLVSTRAGGVGINLTAADTVIIYDSDWNPQNDIQAQARCHRIGQTKEVKIYRLLTKNTKEKEMFEKASKKLGLDRAVLNSSTEYYKQGGKNQNKTGLEKEEIDILLKFGAYSAFKDDTEEEKALMTGDIDSILQRNATVVRYDQTTQSTEKGVSNFSKASFAAAEDDMQVDINDKDFWNKILPDLKNAEGLMRKLRDDDYLKTEEQKAQFMKDIEVLVTAKLEEMRKFRYKEDEDLAALLTQCIYSYKLEEFRREMAREWLEQIDKPRLRSGKEEDKSDSDDDEPKSKGKATVSLANYKKGGWFKAERQRFQKTLLEVGWGRWEEIQEAKLKNHTIEEIHSFAESFVWQLARHAEDEESKKFLKEVVESHAVPEETKSTFNEQEDPEDEKEEAKEAPAKAEKPAEGEMKPEEQMKSETSDESAPVNVVDPVASTTESTSTSAPAEASSSTASAPAEGKAEATPQQVEKVIEVAKLVIDASNTLTACDPIKVTLPSKKYLEGPCRLEIVQQNQGKPNFCIRLHELTDDEKLESKFEIAAPGYEGEFVIKFISSEYTAASEKFAVTGSHPMFLDEEWIDSAKRGCKNWLKKLRFTDDLQHVLDLYGSKLKSAAIPKIPIKVPADWWDEECDRDLLVGLSKYGYGNIESIKSDKTLSIKGKYESFCSKAKTAREKQKAEDSWPTTGALNKRATRLVTELLALKSVGKAASKRAVKEDWSKRERADIQRCLVTFGTCPNEEGEPQYDKIIVRANLKKTAESVESYVTDLLATVAKVSKEGSKEGDSDKKSSEEMGPVTAKKIEQRVNLMKKLSQFVFPSIEDFEDKICLIKLAGSGLPKWYVEKKHDVALIKGVEKHGFDFKKIFADESLDFTKVKVPGKKKESGSLIRDALCLSRLEDLAKLYEKYQVVGSPTKAKSQWTFTPKKTHVTLNSPPSKELNKETKEGPRIRRRSNIKKTEQSTLDQFIAKNPNNETGEDIEEVSDSDTKMDKMFPDLKGGDNISAAASIKIPKKSSASGAKKEASKTSSSSSKSSSKASSSKSTKASTKKETTSTKSKSSSSKSKKAASKEEEPKKKVTKRKRTDLSKTKEEEKPAEKEPEKEKKRRRISASKSSTSDAKAETKSGDAKAETKAGESSSANNTNGAASKSPEKSASSSSAPATTV